MPSPLRSVSNPLSMWSLRNRLVVGVVVLAGLGFAASDIAAGSALRSFLVTQMDTSLTSVAGGTALRLDRAGIAQDEDNMMNNSGEESDDSPLLNKSAAPMMSAPTPGPLRQVPTSMSVTLLGMDGTILGVIGGDLNPQEIGQYISGLTPAEVLSHKGVPYTISAPGADFRVLARVLPSEVGSVVVAQSLEYIDQTVHQLQILFIFIGLIALLLIGLASRKVIEIGLKPLEEVEVTAESIASGNLSARLPEAKPDTEVGRLVASLNQMLARIEESF
ncbi:MAG: HAMP domain-containing protein, partial [Actinobacteria bacterium]|nr:HAMP domain-containing protein [Actinomycetota bacterium]